MGVLEAALEFRGGSAGSEEAVGVVPRRQIDNSHAQTGRVESLRQSAGCVSSGRMGIEGNPHGAVGPLGQLRQLRRGQGNAEGAAGVAKAGLPKHRQIEQTFDQNHVRGMAGDAPGEEASFGTCQESMRRSAAQTAAIKIDGAASLPAREHDPAIERVLARMDQPGSDQQVCRISPFDQVAVEHSTRSVSDGELLDQSRILHAPALQVIYRLAMLLELLPVEVDGFSQRVLGAGLGRAQQLFQRSDGLGKGEMLRPLDKAKEVAALAAAVAGEDVFRRMDVERGVSFPMQGTPADVFGRSADRPRPPVLPPQVIQQREAPLERFQVLAQGGSRGPWRAVAAVGLPAPAPAGTGLGQGSGTPLLFGAVAFSVGRKGEDGSALQEPIQRRGH